MPLHSGSRLGPYEILAPVGAGGMGEVYRAKDTRLDRIVAIKVLPSHLSENAHLKQRFEREARTISQLSHPNICALYDVGHQDGTDYLVMEFLEGETLAHRLDKGAMAHEQVLRYGIEIAEALDKAHRQGIVHRDLKPGNIMLTKSGSRLLDFGLAKYGEQKPDGSASSELETLGRPLTEEGTILGTVQYMSPEQLEGKEVDGRTDIFALGELLYEMSTGKRAFSGDSRAKLISAILTSEPLPVSSVQPLAPPALDHVVKRCLSKDPDDRWQNARDVASQLKWISETSQSKPAAPLAPARKISERMIWIALLLLSLVAGGFLYLRRPAHQVPLLKFSILPPEKTRFTGQLAVSPDGRYVAFTAKSLSGDISLYVRALDSLESKRLPGTEDASYPFWSYDSKFVGFFAHGKLKKIDITEGPPQTLGDAVAGRGGTWNQDGTILFAPNFTNTPLMRISAEGGTATPATQLNADRQDISHIWPYFLPDGRHFTYTVNTIRDEARGTYIGSLDSKDSKGLITGKRSIRGEFTTLGFLLFMREKSLIARPFDLQKEEFTGEGFPVAGDVGFDGTYHSFSVSRSGVLIYSNLDPTRTQLVWMERTGKQLAASLKPGGYVDPYFSPDEKSLILGFQDPVTATTDLWITDLSRQNMTRFTFGSGNKYSSLWSPDGKQIVFSASGRGTFNLYSKESSGAGTEQILLETSEAKFTDDWSRDGKYILYENEDPRMKYDLWVLPMSGDRKPFLYLQTEFNEAKARFSPDGKWVAYASDDIGRSEIYVRAFPNARAGKWQVSTGGGDQPYWRGDGKELFYIAPDGKLMAVEVATGDAFQPGVPIPLFQTGMTPAVLVGSDRNQYLAAADGRRFLINAPPGEAAFAPIQVIYNWHSMMKK